MKSIPRHAIGTVILAVALCTPAFAAGNNFIPAPSRVDMVHDLKRGVVYVTSGTSVLRYQLSSGSFLSPYTFNSGNLSGIDLSPDGNTLAIADRNMTGIHLVDLQSDTVKPDLHFTPASGEGGSFTVAYSNDGSILVTTQYNGSGSVPLRRVDPTGQVSTVSKGTSSYSQVNQNTMLSASADGKCIGYAESNSSDGPLGIYDAASQKINQYLQYTTGTSAYNYEIGTNRDCTQLAVPTYRGTIVYDNNLSQLGIVGAYASGQPVAAAYHPLADIVYFPWAGSSEVRAYGTKNYAQLGSFDVGYTFQNTGNYAFNQGRIKLSRDGSLFLVTVGGGIAIRSTSLAPTADSQALAATGAAPVAITLTGSSPKKLPLSYEIVTQPGHGTLQGSAPAVTYSAAAGFSGQDSFTFRTSDGTDLSAPESVTITIDATAPSVTDFTLPASSSTLTVPVSSFTASDDTAVTGYCLTESATSTGCAWSSTAAGSYRFSSIGTHTLNAFARDAAGNVSAAASATVDIPQIVPRITAFSIPASYGYDNPAVAVTLTASDDLGVTGYCVTESASSDGCNWSYWPPTSYTFSTLGPHTLTAFAKNSSGQLSQGAAASTTVIGQLNFIPAASRKDMVYDDARGVLYITNGTQLLRYKIATNSFLTPYTFGLGSLYGVALSPDGNTLAIADRNITGVHLVDLTTDTVKPDVRFSAYLSGEAGTVSVAFGADGALLATSSYNGSGWAPLRRIDPASGSVAIIKSMISQDSMLSASADGKCIGYAEGNSSNGPLSIYDVASQKVTTTTSANWEAYDVGTNRDCSQLATPTYDGTFLYDNLLNKLGTIGTYAGPQPISVAYHPSADIVYFAWSGSKEVRAYDSKTFAQIASYNTGFSFQSPGNSAYNQGRLKLSRDGALLFVTIDGGVHYQRLGAGAVADNQTVTGYADSVLPITLTGSGAGGAAVSYTIVTPPAHGSLQGSAPNLVYLPAAGFSGTDSLAFTVSDGTTQSAGATLTINVKPVPTAVTVLSPTVKGQLTLTWSDPAGLSFASIRIYRSTAAGSLGSLIAGNLNTTTYTDQGLASQTTYYYTVRVVDAAGKESANTVQSAGTTLDSLAPVTTALPPGGSYSSAQLVTLTASEAAAIYYSTDGSDPTSASPQYTGPITIAATTVLKYFAVDGAGNSEAVKTQNYALSPAYLPSRVTLVLSTAGSTARISGLQATVVLPAGVTVASDATGKVSEASVTLSGGWATGGQYSAMYTPAQPASGGSPAQPGKVVLALFDGNGEGVGEFLRLTLEVAPGTEADASSFRITQVKAVDGTGGAVAGVTVTAALEMDLIPPALQLSTLADRAVTTNPTLNLAGVATDAGGIAWLAVNGAPVPVGRHGEFSTSLLLKGGANVVTTVLRDQAGNETSDTRVITLDRTVPAITMTAPADNATLSGNTLAVAGTAAANCTVELRVNGRPHIVGHAGTAFSAVVTLAAGLNTIEVVARDPLGVESSLKRTVISDSATPTISVTSPIADALLSSGTLTLRGSVSNVTGAATVTVNVAGTIYQPQVVGGAFVQQITLPAEQAYPIMVTVDDEGGSHGVVQRNVIYQWAPSGDLDGDASVTLSDALIALQAAVGLVVPTDAQLREGDVGPLGSDGRPASDGTIDISDAVIILKKTVGLLSW